MDQGLANAERKVNHSVDAIGRTMTSAGRRISSAGRSISTALTVPVVLVGGVVTKMGLDFDRTLTKIDALVGASAKEMDQYRAAIFEVTKIGTAGPKEVAEAMYFITSSGFRGASALKVLRASAMASAAGLGDMSLVADAVTSAVNAYGESALNAESATDVLLATVREGKLEPSELAGAIGRVIAPAQNMGVEFREVGAALAALSLVGLDASEGTTALRGSLMGLLKPAKETRDMLEENGESVQAIREEMAEKGLIPTLTRLALKFRGNADAIGTLFPNVRALNGFLALTGQNAGKTQAIMDRMTGSVGDTQKAYDTAAETMGFKFDNAMANIKLSLTQIGVAILPVVVEQLKLIAGWITRAADAFQNLSPEAQKFVLIGLTIAAALGPALLALGGLVTVIGGVASAIAVIATPIGALVAAIVAIGAAMVAAKYAPDQFAMILEKVGMSAEDAAMLVEGLADAFDTVVLVAKQVWPILQTFVVGTLRQIGAALDIVIGILTLDFKRAWTGIKTWFSNPITMMLNQVKNLASGIRNILDRVWDGMKERAYEAVLAILEPFSHLPGRMGEWARDAKDEIHDRLEEIEAKRAAQRAADNFGEVFVPGLNRVGKQAAKAAEEGLGTVSGEKAAKGIDRRLIPPFRAGGKKAGEAFGLGMVTAMDPFFVMAADRAKITFDGIATSVTNTLNGLADAATRLAPVVWDGKVWRDAQNRVLKDQQAAWDAWNAKMGNSIVQRQPPKKGAQVMLGTKYKVPPKTTSSEVPDPYAGYVPLKDPGEDDPDKDKGVDIGLPEWLRRREMRAAATEKNLKDDIAVLKMEEAYFKKLLNNRKLTKDERERIRTQIVEIQLRIKQLNKDIIAAATGSTDLELITPGIRMRKTRAERTRKNLQDDIAAERAHLKYLQGLLVKNKGDLEKRATIMEEITGVMNRIADLQDEMNDAAKDAADAGGRGSPMWTFLGERQGFFSSFAGNAFVPGGPGGRLMGTSANQLKLGSAPPPTPGSARAYRDRIRGELGLDVKGTRPLAGAAGLGGGLGAAAIAAIAARSGSTAGLAGLAGFGGAQGAASVASRTGRAGVSGTSAGGTGAAGRPGVAGSGAVPFTSGTATIVKLQDSQFNALIAALKGTPRAKTTRGSVATLAMEAASTAKYGTLQTAPRQLVLNNHQSFLRETPDRHREARLALTAMNAVMAGASYDG